MTNTRPYGVRRAWIASALALTLFGCWWLVSCALGYLRYKHRFTDGTGDNLELVYGFVGMILGFALSGVGVFWLILISRKTTGRIRRVCVWSIGAALVVAIVCIVGWIAVDIIGSRCIGSCNR